MQTSSRNSGLGREWRFTNKRKWLYDMGCVVKCLRSFFLLWNKWLGDVPQQSIVTNVIPRFLHEWRLRWYERKQGPFFAKSAGGNQFRLMRHFASWRSSYLRLANVLSSSGRKSAQKKINKLRSSEFVYSVDFLHDPTSSKTPLSLVHHRHKLLAFDLDFTSYTTSFCEDLMGSVGSESRIHLIVDKVLALT